MCPKSDNGEVYASEFVAQISDYSDMEIKKAIHDILLKKTISAEEKAFLHRDHVRPRDWTISFQGALWLIRKLPSKRVSEYLAYLDQCVTEQQAGDARAVLRTADNARSGSAATEAAREELRQSEEGFVGVVSERVLPMKRSAEELMRYKSETSLIRTNLAKQIIQQREDAKLMGGQLGKEYEQIMRCIMAETFGYGQDECKPNKTVARMSREAGWSLNQEQLSRVGRIASELYLEATGKRPMRNEGSSAAYPENVYEPEQQHLVQEAYDQYMEESDGGRREAAPKTRKVKKLWKRPRGQREIDSYVLSPQGTQDSD